MLNSPTPPTQPPESPGWPLTPKVIEGDLELLVSLPPLLKCSIPESQALISYHIDFVFIFLFF